MMDTKMKVKATKEAVTLSLKTNNTLVALALVAVFLVVAVVVVKK